MRFFVMMLFLLVPACIAAVGTVRRIQRKAWSPAAKWCIMGVGAVFFIVYLLFGKIVLFYLMVLLQERFAMYAWLYLWYLAAVDLISTIIILAALHQKPRIRDFTLPLVLVISWILAKLIPR